MDLLILIALVFLVLADKAHKYHIERKLEDELEDTRTNVSVDRYSGSSTP